jgi:hypothetical protein
LWASRAAALVFHAAGGAARAAHREPGSASTSKALPSWTQARCARGHGRGFLLIDDATPSLVSLTREGLRSPGGAGLTRIEAEQPRDPEAAQRRWRSALTRSSPAAVIQVGGDYRLRFDDDPRPPDPKAGVKRTSA